MIPRCRWYVMICLMVAGLCGAAGCERPDAGEVRDKNADDIAFVFHDRRDARLEYVHVFVRNNLIVRVAPFPSEDGKGELYVAENWSLGQADRHWFYEGGEISPSFLPPGPWFSRATVDMRSGKVEPRAYFADDNHELAAWLTSLRSVALERGKRVDKLPAYITDNDRLLIELGLEGNKATGNQ